MVLDIRLRAAADMVPRGSRLADIGSDHAYLPISLCLENKIESALASDINEGPVSAAVANIHKNGLDGRIIAVRADGLDKTWDFRPDCITILGMGGELIVSILDKAEWVRDERITLVLQPMTHPEILAKYLAESGFLVTNEAIVRDGGRDDRIYRIICAKYSGKRQKLTEAEALIGRINLERGDEITEAYIRKNIRILETRIEGRARAGSGAENEKSLVDELRSYLERNF